MAVARRSSRWQRQGEKATRLVGSRSEHQAIPIRAPRGHAMARPSTSTPAKAEDDFLKRAADTIAAEIAGSKKSRVRFRPAGEPCGDRPDRQPRRVGTGARPARLGAGGPQSRSAVAQSSRGEDPSKICRQPRSAEVQPRRGRSRSRRQRSDLAAPAFRCGKFALVSPITNMMISVGELSPVRFPLRILPAPSRFRRSNPKIASGP